MKRICSFIMMDMSTALYLLWFHLHCCAAVRTHYSTENVGQITVPGYLRKLFSFIVFDSIYL